MAFEYKNVSNFYPRAKQIGYLDYSCRDLRLLI